ncbi:MAG: 50S ribosomal protein L18 [uncultured bacterium (gcode 4)]|uniref:Large ribosomal subunit protein uL18 n=1 Tax=uncultured bacterium (gcode 4) TaxID=1234023 RepID=K2GDC5_9BACT|nr:MAG: 50S ribosomal protein L18 [uncultured bacterium (gcode 4)]
MLKKVIARQSRHNRVRAKISGTATKPRLCVYRSNANIYAQFIDDVAWKTLCAASDLKIKKGSKVEKATQVGSDVAEKAMALWIDTCVFDRGGFMYIGRVKAIAEAARAKWLKF